MNFILLTTDEQINIARQRFPLFYDACLSPNHGYANTFIALLWKTENSNQAMTIGFLPVNTFHNGNDDRWVGNRHALVCDNIHAHDEKVCVSIVGEWPCKQCSCCVATRIPVLYSGNPTYVFAYGSKPDDNNPIVLVSLVCHNLESLHQLLLFMQTLIQTGDLYLPCNYNFSRFPNHTTPFTIDQYNSLQAHFITYYKKNGTGPKYRAVPTERYPT